MIYFFQRLRSSDRHFLVDESRDQFEQFSFLIRLAEVTVEFLRPFQDRVKEFDDETLKSILAKGAEKARSIAAETLHAAYSKMGIT